MVWHAMLGREQVLATARRGDRRGPPPGEIARAVASRIRRNTIIGVPSSSLMSTMFRSCVAVLVCPWIPSHASGPLRRQRGAPRSKVGPNPSAEKPNRRKRASFAATLALENVSRVLVTSSSGLTARTDAGRSESARRMRRYRLKGFCGSSVAGTWMVQPVVT